MSDDPSFCSSCLASSSLSPSPSPLPEFSLIHPVSRVRPAAPLASLVLSFTVGVPNDPHPPRGVNAFGKFVRITITLDPFPPRSYLPLRARAYPLPFVRPPSAPLPATLLCGDFTDGDTIPRGNLLPMGLGGCLLFLHASTRATLLFQQRRTLKLNI